MAWLKLHPFTISADNLLSGQLSPEILAELERQTKALALAAQELEVSAEALDTAREFAVRRYEQQLLDAGHDHRFVNAVLPLADAPAVADRAGALHDQRRTQPREVSAVVGQPRFTGQSGERSHRVEEVGEHQREHQHGGGQDADAPEAVETECPHQGEVGQRERRPG